MGGRCCFSGGVKSADNGRIAVFYGGDQHFGGTWRRAGHIAGDTLLQQQFYALDHWFRMKKIAQAPVLHGVGDSGDGHALMMRHKTAHNGVRLIGLQARWCEINRLIKTVAPFGPQFSQIGIVPHSRQRINHCR